MKSRHAILILTLVMAWTCFGPGIRVARPDSPADRRAKREMCRALLRESLVAFEAGHPDSALAHLRTVLECDPGNPDAYYHMARIQVSRNDTTSAITALNQGIRRAPLSSRLKLFLVRLEISRRGLQEAADLVDRVLAIKPDEAEAHYLLGLIHLERGDTIQALDSWQKALQSSDDGGER